MARSIEEIATDINKLLTEAAVAGYVVEAGTRDGVYHDVSTASVSMDDAILIEA